MEKILESIAPVLLCISYGWFIGLLCIGLGKYLKSNKPKTMDEIYLEAMIKAMQAIPPDQWHKPGPVGPEGVKGPEGCKGPGGPKSDY